jgi:hypothetical protein
MMITGTLLSLALSTFVGCSGDGDSVATDQGAGVPLEVPALWTDEDIKRTWVFKSADSAWRGKFEGDPAWTGLFNRDYESALSGASGASAVRMHSEYASIYRQATLMHAHATNHLYDTDRQDEDGNDTFYLRGVARSILGEYDAAKSDFASLENEKLKTMSAQWLPIVDGGWTADSSVEGSFVNVPPVKHGAKFRPETVPHFSIATTVEGVSADATDSTELWVRSKWHEAVARQAAEQAGMDARWVDVFMAPWTVPMETAVAKAQSSTILTELKPEMMDESWLFLSRNLVSEDALFLYDLQFSENPSQTLSEWSGKSLLAKIVLGCLVDDVLEVPKILDAAGQLELDMTEAMKASQGKEEPFYVLFADFAEQAVLIAGVMVADRLGQAEAAGRLRLNARDLGLKNSKDALFLTSFAAWDVANKYPLRAQDLMHKYSGDFPAFKVAGHPLGTLQIRLGRSSGVPGAAN